MTDKYEELLPAIDTWIKLNNPYPCEAPVNIHLDVKTSMDALDTIRQALKLASVAEEMGEALESIANNTCCDKCNEAAKVAKQALAKYRELKGAE